MVNRPFCLLLTGMPRAGKSKISEALRTRRLRNAFVIDGDAFREAQFLGRPLGFSLEDILANTEVAIKLAKFAMDLEFSVLIAMIAPYYEQRRLFRERIQNFHEVYLQCPQEVRAQRPNYRETELVYQEGNPELIIETALYSLDECVEMVEDYLGMGDKALIEAMLLGDENPIS